MRFKFSLNIVVKAVFIFSIFVLFSCKQTILINSIDVFSMNDVYELSPGDVVYCYTEIFPTNASNKTIYWSVDNIDAGYIDQDGVFTALEFIPDDEFGGLCYVEVTAKATDGSGTIGTIMFEIIEAYNDNPDNPSDTGEFGSGNFRSINSLPIYPEINAENVFTDGEFFITFDSDDITLSEDGYILICDEDNQVIDRINFTDERQTVWPKTGVECFVDDQMVYTKDNVVHFSTHYDVLLANTRYFIKIPTGAIQADRGGEPFTGIGAFNEWAFKTKYESSLDTVITVNNSITTIRQNFRTIGAALRAVANGSTSQNYTIKVSPGEYHELIYADLKANVTIEGQGTAQYGLDTVVWYCNNELLNSDDDCTSIFYGKTRKNLVLKNIKIENRTNNSLENSPAITLDNNGGFFAAGNCAFSSVCYTAKINIKSWLYSCFIEGNKSLVSGKGDTILLEKCYVKTLLNYGNARLFEAMTGNIYETADGIEKGIVLFDSELTTDKKDNTPYFAYSTASANMKECYDQVALIDVKINDNYLNKMTAQWDYSILPLYIKKDSGGNMNVGWKSYGCVRKTQETDSENTAAFSPDNNKPYAGTIMDDVYALEYNGRRAILNRSYYIYETTDEAQNTIHYGTYKNSDSEIDDQTLISLEEYFAASEDNSKNNDYTTEAAYIVTEETGPVQDDEENGIIEGITISIEEVQDIEIFIEIAGQQRIFTASDGFKTYTWRLDGEFKSLGKTYTLDTQQLSSGTHVLKLQAERLNDLNYYSTTLMIIKE